MDSRHDPKGNECKVAHGKNGKPMNGVVVAEMNNAVRYAQSNVSPSHLHCSARDAICYVEHQTHHIKENWKLQQIHVVPVADTHVVWHAGGFTELEVTFHYLMAECGIKPCNGNLHQNDDSPCGQRKNWIKNTGFVHGVGLAFRASQTSK